MKIFQQSELNTNRLADFVKMLIETPLIPDQGNFSCITFNPCPF